MSTGTVCADGEKYPKIHAKKEHFGGVRRYLRGDEIYLSAGNLPGRANVYKMHHNFPRK